MAKVDPFVIPIPKALHTDPEVRFYHEYLNKFLHDLWIRTGGGNDDIRDEGVKELYPWQALTDEEPESVFGAFGRLGANAEDRAENPYGNTGQNTDKVEVIPVSGDYTTTGSQIVICTNTASITVTLNPSPDDGEEVHIKRQNTGTVTVSGDIDGDSSKDIIFRYDSPHLVYTVEADEWSIV